MKNISLNEKIFVAGASGMAGSSICRSLKKYGYGSKDFGGTIFTPNRKDLNLLNKHEVLNFFQKNKPTILIIAAAKVGGIYANSTQPVQFLLDNIKIQTNLIETAWEFGVKRLLFLGSSCIYPKLAKQPIREEYLLSGPLEQTNESYAIAKITGIKLCQALSLQYKFDAISLMPTNLYGPGDNYHPENSHVMASLIRKFHLASTHSLKSVNCWGTGSPLREFLHVDDLGDAVVFCLENWNIYSEKSPKDDEGNPLRFLNVGTGMDLSIQELAEKIAKLTNFKGEIFWDKTKPDGTYKKQLDVSRIKKLGWSPKINLDDGIRMTLNNYLEENFSKL